MTRAESEIVAENSSGVKSAPTQSPARSGAAIITFGIACCTLTLAIVLLMAMAGYG
jgi:hypothetical protein